MDTRMLTQGTNPEEEGPVRRPTIEMRVPLLERLSILPLLTEDDHAIIEKDPEFFERDTVRDVSVMLQDDSDDFAGIELLDVDPDDDDSFWRTPALPSTTRETLIASLDSPFEV